MKLWGAGAMGFVIGCWFCQNLSWVEKVFGEKLDKLSATFDK